MITSPIVLYTSQVPDLIQVLQAEDFSIQVESDPHFVTRLEGAPSAVVVNVPDDEAHLMQICAAVQQYFRNVPLLVVTANHSTARQTALNAGADVLLTAPLEVVELRYALQKLAQASGVKLADLLDADALGHDLKGSLGTVISSLDLMREMLKAQETMHMLADDSLQAALRQNMLIENMIDYIRLDSGEMMMEVTPVTAQEVFAEIDSYVTVIAARKRIAVAYEVRDEDQPFLANLEILERVLKSLFDNALKFCTRENQVLIGAGIAGNRINIFMIDDGRVIMPDYLESIFAPPNQFKSRLEGSRTSVAVNLPFVQAAVRMMGGDVTASSNEEQTRFDIYLPLINAG